MLSISSSGIASLRHPSQSSTLPPYLSDFIYFRVSDDRHLTHHQLVQLLGEVPVQLLHDGVRVHRLQRSVRHHGQRHAPFRHRPQHLQFLHPLGSSAVYQRLHDASRLLPAVPPLSAARVVTPFARVLCGGVSTPPFSASLALPRMRLMIVSVVTFAIAQNPLVHELCSYPDAITRIISQNHHPPRQDGHHRHIHPLPVGV